MSGYNYRKYRKLTLNEQWKTAKRKAHLDDIEVAMAMKLNLSPRTVLGMISSETWKDSPPLRIRRLFDERYVNPALEMYWEERGTSPIKKEYQKQPKDAADDSGASVKPDEL